MKKISISFLFLCFIILCCTKATYEFTGDCDTEVDYDNTMAELIDRTCAYEGCHVPGGEGNDFTSYNIMKEGDIEDFPNRVNEKNMPPPDELIQLTDEEIELINCWVVNGYPEN